MEEEVEQWFTEDDELTRNYERDNYGEVLTPMHLLEEIMDHIPMSVWSNPHARWLDCAAGTGHIAAAVFLKLNRTLATVISNKHRRQRHILENMLFLVEINPKNVALLRRRKFVNVSKADFLQLDAPDQPFHVIVGNPPYQASPKLAAAAAAYKGSQGRRTLWNLFVERSLSPQWLQQSGGFLGFITPATWRRPEAPLYQLMTRDHALIYLHIYGEKAGRDIFHVQTRFDVYVIRTGSAQTKTPCTIVDELGQRHTHVHVQEWPFLPNYAFKDISRLLVSDGSNGFNVIFHSNEHDARHLRKNKSAKFRHPVVHTQTRRGLGILFSDRTSLAKSTPKVILNFNRALYPYNDYRGQYGLSQLSFGLPLLTRHPKTEGEALIAFLESPLFQQVVRATKWTSFQTDYRMFRYFDPRKFVL
jgi:16S rRNA G966 N2-methylase RsmD